MDQLANLPRYHIPSGVSAQTVAGRPVLTTPQQGKVAIDGRLLALWQAADGANLPDILGRYAGRERSEAQAALACLVQAGLLHLSPTERRREIVEAESVKTGLAEAKLADARLVSAVIVTYNSLEWLPECIASLQNQTHPAIEIIFVDNGSSDGTLGWLAQHHPDLPAFGMPPGTSLSAAINAGVERANGQHFLILNPDVRLDQQAVEWLVQRVENSPHPAAAAVKLKFWWAPAFLNGLGNRVGSFSWGSDNALGHLDFGQFDGWDELPSGCFAALLVPRPVWALVGPADANYPMYYEDSDWSYRARLLGVRILSTPEAVVYHAFGGRYPSGEGDTLSPFKLANVVYGRYRFAFKIAGDSLERFLRNYWLEDWSNFIRAMLSGQFAQAGAYWRGWRRVLGNWGEIQQQRQRIQSGRVIDDQALFATQAHMPMTLAWHGLPEFSWDIIAHHYLPWLQEEGSAFMPALDPSTLPPHLLIVSNDVVDHSMAGPGMRYAEMALQLAQSGLQVTLAAPNESKLELHGVQMARYWEDRPATLHVLVENADVALISGYMIEKFPFLAVTETRLVVDLYDPFILENLHYYLEEPIEAQKQLNAHAVDLTNRLARVGDFFLCGNERQRDFWLGVLAANGRVNPLTFQADPSLRSLIDVAGIGFPEREIAPQKRMLRGVHPQIPEDAKIVLWGGGIWNWLDPLTLVQAWPQVVARQPKARLVFLGTRHPNPLVPKHRMADQTIALAQQIGELDHTILFIEWVPYAEREALLAEADLGAALHPIHVETRYSIRTRVLDYIWARLPALITEGDITSEWVARYEIGRVVPPHDADAVANAILEIFERPRHSWAEAFTPLLNTYRWSQIVAPLQRFVINGSVAPDRVIRNPVPAAAPAPYNPWARAMFILRSEGPRALLHRGWRYIQWRLSVRG